MKDFNDLYNVSESIVKDGKILLDEVSYSNTDDINRKRVIKIDGHIALVEETIDPKDNEIFNFESTIVKTKKENEIINFQNSIWFNDPKRIDYIILIRGDESDGWSISVVEPLGHSVKTISTILSDQDGYSKFLSIETINKLRKLDATFSGNIEKHVAASNVIIDTIPLTSNEIIFNSLPDLNYTSLTTGRFISKKANKTKTK